MGLFDEGDLNLHYLHCPHCHCKWGHMDKIWHVTTSDGLSASCGV